MLITLRLHVQEYEETEAARQDQKKKGVRQDIETTSDIKFLPKGNITYDG